MTSKILIADESATIRKIVAMAFEAEDEIVEGVSNGQEALDRIPDFKPDILLADIKMPEINGFDLSRKVKSNPEWSHIKILLLSSDFEEFEQEKFADSGADGHIGKPFKSDDVILKIRELLSNKSEGREDGLTETALEIATDNFVNEPPEEDVIALTSSDSFLQDDEDDDDVFELPASAVIESPDETDSSNNPEEDEEDSFEFPDNFDLEEPAGEEPPQLEEEPAAIEADAEAAEPAGVEELAAETGTEMEQDQEASGDAEEDEEDGLEFPDDFDFEEPADAETSSPEEVPAVIESESEPDEPAGMEEPATEPEAELEQKQEASGEAEEGEEDGFEFPDDFNFEEPTGAETSSPEEEPTVIESESEPDEATDMEESDETSPVFEESPDSIGSEVSFEPNESRITSEISSEETEDIAGLDEKAEEAPGSTLQEMVEEIENSEREKNLDEMQEQDRQLIADMEEKSELLKEINEPPQENESFSEITGKLPDFDEDLSEVNINNIDDESDLDLAFYEFESSIEDHEPLEAMDNTTDMSKNDDSFEDIVAEPEDLLEKMAPSVFSIKNGDFTPQKVDASATRISEESLSPAPTPPSRFTSPAPAPRFQAVEDPFVKVVGERIKGVLEQSLDTSIEKEVDGLSEIIVESVREIVREITPLIAREVIKEEIERIKQSEDF